MEIKKKRKGTKGGVTVDFNHNPTDTTSSFVNIPSTEQQHIVATTDNNQMSPKSPTEYNTSIQSHNSHSPLNNHNINNHHSMNHSQQLQLSQFHQNLPKQPQPRMNNHFGNIDSLSFNSIDNDIQHIAALQDRVNGNNNKGNHRRQPSNAVVNVIVANDDAQDGDDNTSSDDDGEQSSSSSFTVDDNNENHLDELAHGHDDVNNTHGNGTANGRGPTTPSTPLTPLTPYQMGGAGASNTQNSAQLRTPQMTPIMGAISGIAGGSGSNFSTPKIQGMSGSTPTQGSNTKQGTDIGYGVGGGGGIQLPKPKTKGHWM